MERMSRRQFVKYAASVGASVGVLTPFVSACASGQGSSTAQNAAAGQGVLISPPVTNNIYWDGWTKGAQAAANDLGMKPHTENYHGDTSSQLNSFNNMQSLNIKGAVTMPNSAGLSPQLFQIAQQQQVYGVNCWNNQPWSTPLDIGDHYLGYFEYANELGFQALATHLFQKMGGRGKILNVLGVAGNLSSEERNFGLQAALQKFPGIEVAATGFGQYSRVPAQQLVSNLLTAHPDVQGIICSNDDSALGAISALKQRGTKALVVGADGVPEMLDAISSGDALATIINNGPWLGGAMVARIYDALNGVTFAPLERMQFFEAFVINTPAEAQALKKLLFSGTIPYDWKKMSRSLHPNDWDMQIGVKSINPTEFWSHYTAQKAANYQLPAAYQKATQSDYDKVDAMYKDHLKSDKFDPVKKLAAPLYVFP